MPFPPDAFAPYNAALKAWIQATGAKAAAADDGSAVGAMHLGTRLHGRLHGVTLLPRGGIAVESRPDCGTTLRIYLPVSRLAPAVAEADVPEAAALTGEVLIVDDDEAILKTTRILCQALKLAPHVARDRREALAVVRRHASRLRAIVLDAHLGQVDTVRLLGAFRLGAPHVPVVLASGSAREAVEKMFRAHPYDVFLPKPYTLAELKGAFLAAATAQDPVAAQDP